MAIFLSGYMLFCGTPAVWLRLPLQDKHNNSDGHTITMEDSFLSSHMSSTYSDCLLYTDVPVSVNTLFSLSFLYIYGGKQTTCTTVWEVFGCCDEERDVISACLASSQLTKHSNSDDSKIRDFFSSQPSMVQWLSSPIFPFCSVVVPLWWHPTKSPLLLPLDPQTHTFSESLW